MEDWQAEMDRAYQSNFEDLSFHTPCNHSSSLNDLSYVAPAGFASFVIVIDEAESEPSHDDLNRLKNLMKTTLKMIWARY